MTQIITIHCKKCHKAKFVSVFERNTRFQNPSKKGIKTKYPDICNDCLTEEERKEVADEIIKTHQNGAVNNKRKEHTRGIGGQPRKRIKYGRQVIIRGE